MAALDDMSIIFPTFNNDPLLTLYIRKAVTLITTYLNLDTEPYTYTEFSTGSVITVNPIDVSMTYIDAIDDYVTTVVNRKGNEGIKQETQGPRSMTYGNDLPDSTKALLPAPFANCQNTRRSRYYHGF